MGQFVGSQVLIINVFLIYNPAWWVSYSPNCHCPLHLRPYLLSHAQCLFKNAFNLFLKIGQQDNIQRMTENTHPSYAQSIIFQCRIGSSPHPIASSKGKKGIIYIHSLKSNSKACSLHSPRLGTRVCFVEADCPLQGRKDLNCIFQAVNKTRQLGC